MKKPRQLPHFARDQVKQGLALLVLLALAALTIAGPTGLLAWTENAAMLNQHNSDISELSERRDELRNRVDLLDPEAADPDLVGELLRSEMNMVHPDEVVITLEEE